MPRLNRLGHVIAGVGDGVVSLNKVAIASRAGAADWFDDQLGLYQAFRNGAWGVYTHDGTTEMLLDPHGANELAGGDLVFAAWTPAGLRSNVHPFLPLAGLKGVGPDGTLAYCENRQDGRGLILRAKDGSTVTLATATVRDVHVLGARDAVWIEGGRIRSTLGDPVCIPGRVGTPRAIVLPSGALWLIYFHGASDGLERLLLQRWGTPIGTVLAIGRPVAAFGPDAVAIDEQTIRATWALNQAESPGSVQIEDVPLAEAIDDLGTTSAPAMAPLPRKLWIAPFWSHSEQYGDTPLLRHVGNAICVTPDARTAATSIVRELDRIRPLGFPLIVASGDYAIPSINDDPTVAWWCSGGNADRLGTEVSRALQRPERPVIAYLDTEQPLAWPTARPSWMADRVWPSVQAYRGPSESLSAFATRVSAMLDRVTAYHRPMVLTPRFDDFNGDATIERTLECMPLYEDWIRDYQIVGFMPFADRRGTGIAKDARLHAWADAFLNANPGRPGRFEYWRETTTDPPRVTILSFYPSAGKAPLTVKAVRSLSGGQADRVIWRQRKKGAPAWTIVANNPATDADHHYQFAKPGVYELGVDVTGPGGMDGTSKPRVVTVTA